MRAVLIARDEIATIMLINAEQITSTIDGEPFTPGRVVIEQEHESERIAVYVYPMGRDRANLRAAYSTTDGEHTPPSQMPAVLRAVVAAHCPKIREHL